MNSSIKSEPSRSFTIGKVSVCVFFAFFLILGFLSMEGYGQPWDEQDEMDILRMNLWEYTRALGMDESAFVSRAQSADLTINALTPISQSIEQDHGISVFYPMAGVVMNGSMPEHTRMILWHMYCWAIFTLGAYALYACCRLIGLSHFLGLLAATILLISPRFFAEGHYNNKDIALMSLTLCTLWQGISLMKKPSYPRALCFAFAGALAANTKVVGFAIWGLCGIFVLIRQIINRSFTRKTLMIGLLTAVSFFVFYALLTPALWADPSAFISYLVGNALAFQRWQNYILFRGTVFDLTQTTLPRYYLPYMIWVTTPIWILITIAIGQISAVVSVCKKNALVQRLDQNLSLILITLLWVLPLAFAVATGTTVYNGWRHFYFLYGPMILLAAYGVSTVWRKLYDHRILMQCLTALLIFSMVTTAIGISTQHPYQYAYYQSIVLAQGSDYLELDHWNVSATNALRKLAQQVDGNIQIGYSDLWSQNALEHAVFTLPEDEAARFTVVDGDAKYILENPTYSNFSGFEPTDTMEPIVTIISSKQPIMRIYEDSEAAIAPKEN